MKSREDIFTTLVNNIWNEESTEFQKSLLKSFNDNYRICNYDYLASLKAFMIFNDDYLTHFYDNFQELTSISTGLYSNLGKCVFNKRLVIPLTGFDDKVYGFVGYDNGNDCKTDEDRIKHIPYLYMSDKYFAKDKFWLLRKDEYISAYNNQYICLVDGIFDKVTLQGLGYNTASLLGSSLTKYHRDYLRYIKNWVVFSDSDLAGNRLYDVCKNYHPNTIQIQVGNAKDVDERLRNEPNAKVILDKLFKTLKKESFLFNHSLEEFV